ncbi:glycosyltransferase family 2 protein [Aquabacterium sp. A08]|uniref:glycosyltransferase family 2 protein n=1 Tax=Aquabacterium sp. A08 TaxID=2718532 RepID=UPI00141D7C0C|nr:glycosyltransferase family A protein [Aquabacterium sp. A08]NIC41039.1 glycosyltransferase family 2 protein [Aquabacterium sp. A08]
MIHAKSSKLGLVAIGRNEGERLRACLASVRDTVPCVVYVDSGSTDGSVAMAQAMGVHVVNLDMTVPFTAARARNEGWRALLALAPDLQFIQFVDGDCAVAPGWLDQAQTFMNTHPEHAAVCGRRREKFPERSIYNRLCDWEWDTPVGDALACGGDVLMRVSALKQVGGYRDDLIAGEEPELCVRLRQAGWRIHRLGADMTLHDAAMTRFGQWWRRTVRGGHAFAEGAWLHGAAPERHWVKETRRAAVWGLVLPLLVVGAAVCLSPGWWGLAAVYPLQVLRLARMPGGGLRGFFLVLGKFPEAWGVLQFAWGRLWRKRSRLIEYK